jgi:predicted trehalose synthase
MSAEAPESAAVGASHFPKEAGPIAFAAKLIHSALSSYDDPCLPVSLIFRELL